MRTLKGAADAHRLTNVLRDLVAIPSVNPALQPDSPGEADIAQYIKTFCTSLGLDTSLQEVFPGRPNVIARLDAPGTQRYLVLEAHTDTVSLGDMAEGFRPEIANGRLYGRGACDTKGSLAAMLHSLELLLPYRNELNHSVVLAATADEEYTYRGVVKFLDARIPAYGAIVGEPTELGVVLAHKGSARCRITTQGRAAHTSRPGEGDNAISQMVQVIRRLEEFSASDLARLRHPLCGPATLTVSRIQGGTGLNIVPAQCHIDLDRRTLPNEDPEQTLAEIDQLLADLMREHPEIKAQRSETFLCDWGLDTQPDATIARAAAMACEAIISHTRLIGVPYGTDASKLANLGDIPSIVLGPGSIQQAHTADEWVDLDQVARAAEIYAQTILTFQAVAGLT